MRLECAVLLVLAGTIFSGGFLRAMEMDRQRETAAGSGDVWSYRDDAWFLYGMIEHHKGAMEMARVVLQNGSNETVNEWAQAIIRDQTNEIETMQAIIDRLGLRDYGDAIGSMRDHMAEMMEEEFSPVADVNFVAMMIPHHASAIDMALPALVESDVEQIRTVARDIIISQTAEIYEFRQWLDMKGYKP